ncbi:hypothetical protein NDU88_007738 [Pleurodeles waltl]|uniref:Uncharacterized protein n=1 Tax=Pleurodeles waltl TaxID=8319 RepID=A0AAV7QMY3_PLEWA|nr:hypothetical protein NDU88_007738 [Pleurodeles waltl]
MRQDPQGTLSRQHLGLLFQHFLRGTAPLGSASFKRYLPVSSQQWEWVWGGVTRVLRPPRRETADPGPQTLRSLQPLVLNRRPLGSSAMAALKKSDTPQEEQGGCFAGLGSGSPKPRQKYGGMFCNVEGAFENKTLDFDSLSVCSRTSGGSSLERGHPRINGEASAGRESSRRQSKGSCLERGYLRINSAASRSRESSTVWREDGHLEMERSRTASNESGIMVDELAQEESGTHGAGAATGQEEVMPNQVTKR